MQTTVDGPVDVFVCLASLEEKDLAQCQDVMFEWVCNCRGNIGPVRKLVLLTPIDIWGEPMNSEKIKEVRKRLGLEKDQMWITSFTKDQFQLGRRMAAEALAGTSVYVVADHDCVPLGADEFIPNMLGAALPYLGMRPNQFRMLSVMPVNANIVPWTPEDGYKPVNNDTIMEHVDVGGIRFMVKGHMQDDWDMAVDPRVYDRQHAEQIRRKGGKVGYVKTVGMVHRGERNPVGPFGDRR